MSGADEPGPDRALRVGALNAEDVAAVLRNAGARHLRAEDIRADVALGAPANADGTVNLLTYGAWMLRELARREGGTREP